MIRLAVAIAGSFTLCPPTLADMVEVSCHFTTECFDTEACAQADYSLSFQRDTAPKLFAPLTTAKPHSASGMAPGQFFTDMRDEAQTIKMLPFSGGSHYGLHSFGADSSQRLLSVKDGVARYSIHMLEEGIALFYLGTCTEITS